MADWWGSSGNGSRPNSVSEMVIFCVQLGLLDSMRGPPNLNLINQRILSRRRSTIGGHAFPVAGAYM